MTGMGFDSCADEEDPSSVSSSLVNYGGKMIDVFWSWYVDQYVHDHISTTFLYQYSYDTTLSKHLKDRKGRHPPKKRDFLGIFPKGGWEGGVFSIPKTFAN